MLDSPGYDAKLPWTQYNLLVTKLQAQDTFQYEKKLVFVLVLMPNELPLQFCQLHMLGVEFTHHVGIPIILDLREFLGEVHRVLLHEGTALGRRGRMWASWVGQPRVPPGGSMLKNSKNTRGFHLLFFLGSI
jgi:hypothetical protein